MSRVREKLVDLYAPDGTPVSVGEKRAEVLKGRGYTTSKPRKQATAGKGGRQADATAAELEARDARIAELEAQLAEATAPTPEPTK